MNRRKFIGNAASLASSAIIAGTVPLSFPTFGSSAVLPGLVAVKGTDCFNNVKLGIQRAGGIDRFVPSGSSVGLLVNSRFEHRGTLVNPEVVLALLDLIRQTGPREIIFLQLIDDIYWERALHKDILGELLPVVRQVESNSFPSVFNDEDFILHPEIAGAVHLQNIEVIRKIMEVDVFINVPLIKHHPTTLMTGALKNMMGLTSRKTNVNFHLGSGVKNDPGYLGRCIADLNLLRKPDLVVADATELIINNGPSGPGDTITPDTIIVSTDPVAVDAYGCGIMDIMAEDVHSIVCAHESGLGELDLGKMEVSEIMN